MIATSKALLIAAGVSAAAALLIFLGAVVMARRGQKAAYYSIRRDAQRSANQWLLWAFIALFASGLMFGVTIFAPNLNLSATLPFLATPTELALASNTTPVVTLGANAPLRSILASPLRTPSPGRVAQPAPTRALTARAVVTNSVTLTATVTPTVTALTPIVPVTLAAPASSAAITPAITPAHTPTNTPAMTPASVPAVTPAITMTTPVTASRATQIPEPTSALISATETITQAASGAPQTPTPPRAGVAPNKRLTLVSIASDIDAAGDPVNAGTTFSEGVKSIYVFFDFLDVPPNALLRHAWFRNGGSVYFFSRRFPGTSPSGTSYVVWSPAGGFRVGLYEVRVQVGGVQQFVANFEVN